MQLTSHHRTTPTLSCHTAFRLFFLIVLFNAFIPHGSAQHRCGTKALPSESFEPWLKNKIQISNLRLRRAETANTIHEIPIVIHVIEPASGGTLGITDERIRRQIEILNEDFRRTNADAVNTPAVFLPVAADIGIQFSLAKQDPLGNPTNGIVRVVGKKDRYSVAELDLIRSESFWPPDKYLNFYVLDIQTFFGWASLPITDLPGINNNADDYTWDGVLVDYEFFGENPSSPFFESFGRTGTHEIGHYLGLRHIWGDGGCGVDDFVEDTPEADIDNGGLSSPCTFPNPSDPEVCTSEDEMFQNYMDYTDDTCMNLFTQGQKERMRAVVENSPRRISLLSSPGLVEPARNGLDLAVTSVSNPRSYSCLNQVLPMLTVTNFGTTTINSFDIELQVDGVPSQLVSQTVTLESDKSITIELDEEFIENRAQTFSFTVSNVNSGVDEDPSNNTIQIVSEGSESISLPFYEDFEAGQKLSGRTGSVFAWQVSNAPDGEVSNQAIQFKSFENTTAFGENTVLKTPVFNLVGLNSAELSFSYSHAHNPNDFWDGLTLMYSTDCGATFSQDFLFNSYGPNLSTAENTTASYAPTGAQNWRDTTINITKLASTDGVQFAFVGQNGGNNNIFLDNISIVQTEINALDISLTNLESPLLTCRELAPVRVTFRNVGFQVINSLTYEYDIEGIVQSETLSNLSIFSGDFATINLNLPLNDGDANQLIINITQVNGTFDEDLTNNVFTTVIEQNTTTDTYPLLVDFEIPNQWKTPDPDQTQIWEVTNIDSNGSLRADAFFETTTIGTRSWFISPALRVGSLDSAGLSFKVSYAERTGFNDRLQVLMSVNCGQNYTMEILDADSDSLAITSSNSSWIPSSEDDWKTFELDLKSSIIWQDEIRIAFVFTNGNGNNLYIDDINIGVAPETIPEGDFTLYPNPAKTNFNLAFQLSERDDVHIQVVDMSGRIVYTRKFENILDQVVDFDTISQEGFYFVKVTGNQINQTKRLYIRR